MKQTVFLLLFSLFGARAALSQAALQPSAPVVAALEKVRTMEGDWQGTGWIQMGPRRHDFIQTEHVALHANGTAITIDGLGRDAADTTVLIHQAFAVLSYDQQAGRYLMRAIRADGNHVDADFEVKDDGSIEWGFAHPMAGQIRYTIRIENDTWTETGKMSRDGQNWIPFFFMELKRH